MQVDIPLCPILKPTFQEFKHFESYVEKVEKEYRGQYGMVKIIPPPQWVSRSKDYEARLQNIKIIKPEYQTLCGNRIDYFYKCHNEKCDRMTLRQFKQIASKKEKEIAAFRKHTLIEQEFWKTVHTLKRQIYCANIETSLMDVSSQQWELEKLNSFFSKIVTEKIHGLNTSFLFIGAWKTFFNWHIEDLDLSAINLLHQGAPKVWYAVHPQDRKKFEGIMGSLFPDESMKCSNFLRHKQVFTDPFRFKKNHPSIRISKMFQCEGEISIAFAEAYHSGFNMGYNIAQAVNYGTSDWLQRYSKFKGCGCPLKIGVKLNHSEMIQNIKKNRLYKEVYKVPAFNKIVQKVKMDSLPDELFEQADSMEVEKEIEKAKSKSINKGKKLIYVSKFNRYFPADKVIYLGCDECQAWRRVSTKVHDEMKKKKVVCKDIGYSCKESTKKSREMPIPKNKKISKKSKPVSLSKGTQAQGKNKASNTIMITRSNKR